MSTIDKLRAIPDLAALVYLARDTPHRPADRHGNGTRTGSPIPADVACWDAMRSDEHGLQQWLIEACEEVRKGMAAPPPMPSPYWSALCADLIDLAPRWQADADLDEWVRDSVGEVWRPLSRWIGDPKPPRMVCPHCFGHVHEVGYGGALSPGKSLRCGKCERIYGAPDVAHEAQMRTPLSLPKIAEMLDVTDRTLRRWATAGVIHPVTDHEPSPRSPALYLPEEVRRAHAMIRVG